MQYVIHVDGGSRGNPGPGAAGVVVVDRDSNRPIHEAGYFLGHTTNNVAEYTGLIRSLQVALSLDAPAVQVYSDSQLMVRQINGQYRVKSPLIRPLYEQAIGLLGRIDHWEVTHVRREYNKRADELANLAMDQKKDVVIVGSPALPSG